LAFPGNELGFNQSGAERKMRRILIALLFTGLLASSCQKTNKPVVSQKACLNLANAYYTNGLYEAAVNQYLQYLKDYSVKPERQANTYYTIANIYFDRLNDYQKALEYYFKIKYLFPQSHLQKDVSQKIVACLERLDRSQDAVRVMEKEAALDTSEIHKSRPGAVLATIGNRKITQGDLDFEIRKMPPYLRDQFKSREKKKELLQQLILQDLLYESAKRKGLSKDKDVIEGVFEAKKALMANKLLQQELQDKVKIDPEEIQLYYKANKDKYAERDKNGKIVRHKSFAEVQQQVAQDLMAEKQQKAYQELANRLMQAENVKIYDQRIQ